MSGRNILGYLIQIAIAVMIFTAVAMKHGVAETAMIFGVAIGLVALLVIGINLSMETRR